MKSAGANIIQYWRVVSANVQCTRSHGIIWFSCELSDAAIDCVGSMPRSSLCSILTCVRRRSDSHQFDIAALMTIRSNHDDTNTKQGCLRLMLKYVAIVKGRVFDYCAFRNTYLSYRYIRNLTFLTKRHSSAVLWRISLKLVKRQIFAFHRGISVPKNLGHLPSGQSLSGHLHAFPPRWNVPSHLAPVSFLGSIVKPEVNSWPDAPKTVRSRKIAWHWATYFAII